MYQLEMKGNPYSGCLSPSLFCIFDPRGPHSCPEQPSVLPLPNNINIIIQLNIEKGQYRRQASTGILTTERFKT